MLQLENTTPFVTAMALFPDEHGIDTLYVMLKASFDIGQEWSLSENQLPLVEADEYWDEPENSSLKQVSDYHIGKPATDIIMLGLASTPEGQMQTRHNVHLQVGSIRKNVAVFGDREWQNGHISTAKPFNRMPLVYEKAFGGTQLDDKGEPVSADLRNPLGLGYAGERSVQDMERTKLPNLEDPDQLICHFQDTPAPACFSFVHAAWQPRAKHAGTYDEDWQQNRAPYLPSDFSRKHLNSAPEGLVYPGYLQGGEPVIIEGMHPKGTLNFELPRIIPTAHVHLEQRVQQIDFNLESLILKPNQLQLSMVWRAALACNKKAIKISKVRVAQKR